MRLLTVNADDFGFTTDVNAGIVHCHRHGILTATTLMANGGAYDDAVRLAGENPTLDIGCHLVLVQGPSLARPGQMLPATVAQLTTAVVTRSIPVESELRAQIDKILASGLRPVHLDTHKHTHLLPPVLRIVAKLSAEYGIPWVRRPFDYPRQADVSPTWKQRAAEWAMHGVKRSMQRTLCSMVAEPPTILPVFD